MKNALSTARAALRAAASARRAEANRSFFKCGPGEYGHGDRFLGVSVPDLRRILRAARTLDDSSVEALLDSPWHEERLLGVLVLVERARDGDDEMRRRTFLFYLRRLDAINNWDLVDSSAHLIVGPALAGSDGDLNSAGRRLSAKLLSSKRLWDRRVAVIATLHFTRRGRFEPTLSAAKRLLDDPEDLMHKAVGWMLREVGKRDVEVLRGFLDAYAGRMPRTALRYAIERLPETERRSRLISAKISG